MFEIQFQRFFLSPFFRYNRERAKVTFLNCLIRRSWMYKYDILVLKFLLATQHKIHSRDPDNTPPHGKQIVFLDGKRSNSEVVFGFPSSFRPYIAKNDVGQIAELFPHPLASQGPFSAASSEKHCATSDCKTTFLLSTLFFEARTSNKNPVAEGAMRILSPKKQ